MSLDSLEAAKKLLAAGRWRSSLSRAYYAVYARVTAELAGKASFAVGREGPSHDDLPDLLFDYLTRLSPRDRWSYPRTVAFMYQSRVSADYKPSQTIGEAEARHAVSQSDAFFKAMEAAYD